MKTLAGIIADVHEALSRASQRAGGTEREELKPAIALKKSVTPDYIVCLEDGKKFKSLKRHLRTHYNLSPEEYREKWGLPHDYPMVAPNYAAARSQLAKQMGLGTRKEKVARGHASGQTLSPRKSRNQPAPGRPAIRTSATTPSTWAAKWPAAVPAALVALPVQVGCERMSSNLASSAVGFSAVRLPRAQVQAESKAASLRS